MLCSNIIIILIMATDCYTDVTCEICGRSGLRGERGLKTHQRINRGCNRALLSQQQEQTIRPRNETLRRQYILKVQISLPEAHVWIGPQIVPEVQPVSVYHYRPEIQQFFQDLLAVQERLRQEGDLDNNTTNNTTYTVRDNILEMMSNMLVIRHCKSLYYWVNRWSGNIFYALRPVLDLMGQIIYLSLRFVCYFITLVLIVVIIYSISYEFTIILN